MQKQVRASIMEKSGVSVMKLPSQLLTEEDIDRINKMFAVPRSKEVAAEESGKQDPVVEDLAQINYAPAVLCPIISKHFYNVHTPYVNPQSIQHDESFMGFRPTVSTRCAEAVTMFRKTITIGFNATMDVDLRKYGFCNYVSGSHATIIVNKRTGFHEIINHSQYGTYINNTLFGKAELDADKENTGQVNGFQRREPQILCKCCGNTNFRICDRQGAIRIGHGFVISFGCISFVFSVLGNM